MKAKGVMILGLDGATWKIIDYGIKNGKLPFFEKLKKTGCYGTLMSTVPALTSPALPTLYTGKNPGKHGIFGFIKQDDSLVSLNDISDRKLWNYTDENGLKSLIMELRLTYPPEKINGVMVSSDRDFPSVDSNYVYPLKVKETLGDFYITKEWDYLKNLRRDVERNKEKIMQFHSALVRKKIDAFERVFKSNDFDFSIMWLAETDSMQHYVWKYPDALIPLYSSIENRLQDLLKIMKDWNFIIMSDHGFGPSTTKNFHVNTWLESEGYLKVSGGSMSWAVKGVQSFLGNTMHRFGLVRNILKKIVNSSRSSGGPETIFSHRIPGLVMESTKAYLQQKWGITIVNENVRQGEYESIRNEIIQKLRSLKDDDGTKIIKNVWKKEDIFSGNHLDNIPDIVFLTTDIYEPEYNLALKTVTNRPSQRLSGEHDMHREGIFIAFGPDIKKCTEVKNINIVDITPTILHAFGIKLPKDLDGRAINEIFVRGFRPRKIKSSEKMKAEKLKIMNAVKGIKL